MSSSTDACEGVPFIWNLNSARFRFARMPISICATSIEEKQLSSTVMTAASILGHSEMVLASVEYVSGEAFFSL